MSSSSPRHHAPLPVRIALAVVVIIVASLADVAPNAWSADAGCGSSGSDPGPVANAGGYGLEPGISAMNSHYVVRAIGPLDPSVSAELNAAISRIDQLTHATLVRGADEAMPPGENPTIFPVVAGEIDVFTNVWNSGPYLPYFGNWTYEVPAGGRVSGAVISITTGTFGGLARPAVWHELGHAVGLDHYFSRYEGMCQMMSYGNGNLTDYQAGDLNGLAALAYAGGFGPAPAALPPAPLAEPAPTARPGARVPAGHSVSPANHSPSGTVAPAPTAAPATTVPVTVPASHRVTGNTHPVAAPTQSGGSTGGSTSGTDLGPSEAALAVLSLGYVLVHRYH